MADFSTYIQDVANRSDELRKTLVEPFRVDDGTFMIPKTQAEAEERNRILESAAQNSVFEMAGESAPMIAGVCARALQGYEMRHKRQPSRDLLASAHKAIENVLLLTNGKVKGPGVFEGVEMSTTAGIQMRDRLVSLVLPVYLTMITSNMVTYIPGDFNQSEFFRIKRQAGSNFGDLKKGDVIDYNYQGVYSQMAQTASLGTGDGSTTAFSFDSNTTYSTVYPLKPKRIVIYLDQEVIGSDNGEGALMGAGSVNGVSYTVGGTVTYIEGKVSLSITPAPPADTELEIDFDVDIEKAPRLIPRVGHFISSRVLYPHEAALTGDATILAIWTSRRKLSQALDSTTMKTMRNVLAADKDRKHLHDMYRFCPKEDVTWVHTKAEGISLTEHYETVKMAVFDVDNKLMKANGIAGLTGIVAGTQACNVFRCLPNTYLEVSPGYRFTAQPHFVGRLFNYVDLYCDPYAPDPWSCLCYAKGPDHGQTAYVAGDAIPTLAFNDSITRGHEKRTIIGELAYRDIQPFDGSRYLHRLTFTER